MVTDEGFIEVTFDPILAQEDNLFPASIFITCQPEDKTAIHGSINTEPTDKGRDSSKQMPVCDQNGSETDCQFVKETRSANGQAVNDRVKTSTMITDSVESNEFPVIEQKKASEMELQMEDREVTDPVFTGVETLVCVYFILYVVLLRPYAPQGVARDKLNYVVWQGPYVLYISVDIAAYNLIQMHFGQYHTLL